jgi:SAM-dependent methyltransferase
MGVFVRGPLAHLALAMDASTLHWQRTYLDNAPDEMSWFEAVPEASLELIEEADVPRSASIVDIGGGASRLAGELLLRGYSGISVADISAAALEHARANLGEEADRIEWVEADVRTDELPRRYDLWHDRAVFHFMFSAEDREAYLANLRRALRPGGHLIIATFGPQGPERCSGLPVRRYGASDLTTILGGGFELLASRLRTHATPTGSEQQFHYALLCRSDH